MANRLSRRCLLGAAGAMTAGSIASSVPTESVPASGKQAGGAAKVLREPARDVPVIGHFDLCVVGGSCTGLFAAVAAARLGASVCLVENLGFFGGTATASMVNVWHSPFSTDGKRRIIAGMTVEVMDRLKKRNAVAGSRPTNPNTGFTFNSAELILELDAFLADVPKVRPMLHTRFVAPVVADGKISAAIVEDKTGRRAIAASQFIDATGDADLAHRCGLATYKDTLIQPPTTCVHLMGLAALAQRNPGFRLGPAVFDRQYPEALAGGFLWTAKVPNVPDVTMIAGTRVHGADCSDADQRTAAELEGRRQVRAMCDLLRKHFKGGAKVSPVALPARIGVRDGRHVRCLHQLTEKEVLAGKRFDDAIANGSYRVDVHHADRAGLTFRYLDGREVYIEPGKPHKNTRWRPKSDANPTFYQVPYRSLVPKGAKNLLIAGRCLDADRGAFGAARVMVNCNQMGQAAGTAAALALQGDLDVGKIDTAKLRKTLAAQGAVII